MSDYQIPSWIKKATSNKIIDRLEPIKSYWYQKDDEKIFPDLSKDEALEELESYMSKGYSQHLIGPQVTESICTKGEDGKSSCVDFNATINGIESIVMYLVSNNGWKLVDAITLASSVCPRCADILESEISGEVYDSKEHNTHCDHCSIIDPEFDKNYREKHKDIMTKLANEEMVIDNPENILFTKELEELIVSKLSPRQKDVFELMIKGYSTTQIANKLNISYTRVDQLKRRIRGETKRILRQNESREHMNKKANLTPEETSIAIDKAIESDSKELVRLLGPGYDSFTREQKDKIIKSIAIKVCRYIIDEGPFTYQPQEDSRDNKYVEHDIWVALNDLLSGEGWLYEGNFTKEAITDFTNAVKERMKTIYDIYISKTASTDITKFVDKDKLDDYLLKNNIKDDSKVTLVDIFQNLYNDITSEQREALQDEIVDTVVWDIIEEEDPLYGNEYDIEQSYYYLDDYYQGLSHDNPQLKDAPKLYKAVKEKLEKLTGKRVKEARAKISPKLLLEAFLKGYEMKKQKQVTNINKCAQFRSETSTCMSGAPQTGVQRGRDCPYIDNANAKQCQCYRS